MIYKQFLLNLFGKTISGILFILHLVSSGTPQEVGIYGSKIWTGHYEIQDPIGGGAFISLPLLDQRLRLNFEYSYHQNNREFTGRVIGGFIPIEYMSPIEQVESRSWRKSFMLTLSIKTFNWSENQRFLGGGYSLSKLEGQRKGLSSGVQNDLWDMSKNGIVFLISYYRTSFILERLNFISKILYQIYGSSIYATDIENTFNQEMEIIELQFGLAWSLF